MRWDYLALDKVPQEVQHLRAAANATPAPAPDPAAVKRKRTPMKACPNCRTKCHVAVRSCACGHIFSFERGKDKKKRGKNVGAKAESDTPRTMTNHGGGMLVVSNEADY